MRFTTGGNRGGYYLDRATFRINTSNDKDDIDLEVSIRTGPDNPDNMSRLHILSRTSSISNNTHNAFDAPTNTFLKANTTYTLVAECLNNTCGVSGNDNYLNMGSTSSNAEDSDGLNDWSIWNTSIWRFNTDWVANSADYSPRIRIFGYAASLPYIVDNGMRISSTPTATNAGDTYTLGDLMTFEAEFSEAVKFSNGNRPQFCFKLSATEERCAHYVGGHTTGTLRFEYTVVAGDTDSDGIFINDNSGSDAALRYASGSNGEIQDVDTSVAAFVDHPEVGMLSGHKIDSSITRPEITDVEIVSSPAADDTYYLGETVEVEVTFDTVVTVVGTPELTISLTSGGAGDREATYRRGRGTTRLMFGYEVTTGDLSSGARIPANALAVDGDPFEGLQGSGMPAIRKQAGSVNPHARLRNNGVSSGSAHQVDGATVQPGEGLASSLGQTTTISNRPVGAIGGNHQSLAARFETGTNSYGYTLTAIDIRVASTTGSPNPRVSLYSYVPGAPDTRLVRLTDPASFGTGNRTFTLAAGYPLEAETFYWIVIENTITTDGNHFGMNSTTGTGLDAGAAAGWAIDGWAQRNTDAGTWSPHTGAQLPVAIKGTITANSPATGKPVIQGTAKVAEELSLDLSDLADADGLPAAFTFTYQWMRVDGMGTETDIATGGANSTYTLVAADEGHTIKVEVSFTDDAGGAETLASDAFPAGGTIAPEYVEAVLVSNIGKTTTAHSAISASGNMRSLAQKFTVASGSAYVLTQATIHTPGTNLNGASLTIHEPGTGGTNPKAAALYTLIAPSSLSGSGNKTFTAPANARLSAGADYFLHVSTTNTVQKDISFTVDNGEDDSSTAGWTIADESRQSSFGVWSNNSGISLKMRLQGYEAEATSTTPNATGAPAIEGAPQVGEELTAVIGTIADTDGLPTTFPDDYSFQWVRVDSSDTETDIATNGMTGTYTPVAADVGHTLKVKVSFNDDGGIGEGPLTSEAYPVVGTVVAAKTDCPADNDWCSEMTAGYESSVSGSDTVEESGYVPLASIGALVNGVLTRYTVSRIYVRKVTTGGTVSAHRLEFTVGGGTLPDDTVLTLNGTAFTVGADSATTTIGKEEWDLLALGLSLDDWVKDQKVTASLKLSTAAIGQPAVEGAPQVDETLTAGIGTIADPDGLPSTAFPAGYSFQWIRVDSDGSSNPVDIGADSSTYTPVAADVGKRIIVEVSFTDGESNAEGPLASATYPAVGTVVVAKTACPADVDWCAELTSGYSIETGSGGDAERFGYLSATSFGDLDDDDFSRYTVTFLDVYKFTNTFGTVTSHDLAINVTGGTLPDGTVLTLNGMAFTVGTDSENATPRLEQWDLLALGLSLDDWVKDQKVTASVKLATQATGRPAIDGAPQVDETLTAGAGNIDDIDGLPATTFPTGYTFQWIRVDSDGVSNPANITLNGDSQTYTPVSDDVGKRLMVRVGFTDGGGNAEAVTSAAYPARGFPPDAIGVAAAKTACPTGNDWCEDITVGADVGTSISLYGYDEQEGLGSITGNTVDIGGTDRDLILARINHSGIDRVLIGLDNFAPRGTVFTLGGVEFIADASSEIPNVGEYSWLVPSGFSMAEDQKMTMSVTFPPEVDTATVDGTTLVLTYNEALDHNSAPVPGAYSVKVDGGTGPALSSLGISGSTVTLNLATAVTSVQTVTVSYTVPAVDPLKAADSGVLAGALTDYAVTNNTAAASCTVANVVWCATLTPVAVSGVKGCGNGVSSARCSGAAQLSDDDFDYDNTDYAVHTMWLRDIGNRLEFKVDDDWTAAADNLTLVVDGTSFAFADATITDTTERRWNNSGLSWTAGTDVAVSLVGTGTTTSNDATLSGLTLEDTGGNAIALTPGFAAATTAYEAAVANTVTRVTVEATPNDSDATVEYQSVHDLVYTDADSDTAGFQINLDLGLNYIIARVTAEDGVTTRTYEVQATRLSDTTSLGDALISNLGIYDNAFDTDVDRAQAFTTGPHARGYRLDSIVIAYLDLQGDGFTAELWSTDAAGRPDARLHTLTPPASFAYGNLTFIAPAGVTLDADTTYTVVIKNTAGDVSQGVSFSGAEDPGGATGWSIADAYHNRRSGTTTWTERGGTALAIAVKGGEAANIAPEFPSAAAARSLDETVGDAVVAAPFDIGDPFEAFDANGDALTYTLEGPDAAKFDFDAVSRQIRTVAGESYDYEARSSYSVVVKADDGDAGGTVRVTVELVDNTDETPLRPDAPDVEPVAGDPTSLDVSWTAPGNTGRPAIAGYDVQYRKATETTWTDGPMDVRGTSTTVTGLDADSEYQARVRARNADGAGEWSSPGGASGGTGVTANFASSSRVAHEGGRGAQVTVRLNRAPEAPVTIPLRSTPRGGASAADYSGIPSSLTFDTDETSMKFDVTAVDDSAEDPGESVRIAFGGLPAGVMEGAQPFTDVELVDNDGDVDARVSYSSGGIIYATENGKVLTISARVVVELDRALDRAVTIPITTTHLGGASSSDYSGVPESVTFAAGETEVQLLVAALNDDEDDDNESVRLGFGTLPNGIGIGDHPVTTVGFRDGDGVNVWSMSFDKTSYTAREGGGPVTITVSLDEPWKPWLNVALRVPLQTPEHHGGATAADYTDIPDSVIIPVGETSASFEVRAVDDSANDDGESIEIKVGRLPGDIKLQGGPRTAKVRLADNDGARAVTVSFGASNYTAVEGGSDATVRVELNAAPQSSLTIPLTVTRSGASTSDYSGVPSSVTFGPNDTAESFTVTAEDDPGDDDYESIEIGFGSLPTRVTRGSPSTATVTLEDNDAGVSQALTVGFDSDDSTARQLREGGSFWLGISLDKAPEQEVTIPLRVVLTGGATAADYAGVKTSVTFAEGERSSGFSVQAVDDADVDDGEGLRIEFGNLPAGVSVNSRRRTATFSIIDNDALPGISVADASVREWPNPQSYLKFVVTLDQLSQHVVRVDYATSDGTAVAGQDYETTTGTLVFDPGDRTKNIWVLVHDDSHDEGTETMTLRLSNAREGRIDDGVAEGRIRNTDAMPTSWLTRFGRASSMQALEAIESRMRGGPQTSHLTIGGRRVDPLFSRYLDRGPADSRTAHGRPANGGLADSNPADGSQRHSSAVDRSLAVGSATLDNPDGGGLAGGSLAAAGGTANRSLTGRDAANGGDAPNNLEGGGAGQLDLSGSGLLGAIPDDGLHAVGAPRPGTGRTSQGSLRSLGGLLGLPDLNNLSAGSSFFYTRPAKAEGEESGQAGQAGEPDEARASAAPRDLERSDQPGWLGQWSVWGQSASTRFSGADGPLSVNGDVTTATVGVDSQWNRWFGGLVLATSEGQGAYTHRSAKGGTVTSMLTSLNPFARYELNDRTSFWGALGYGVGELSLTPKGAESALETDLTNTMAAFGGRGVLSVRSGRFGGFELAMRSDALMTNTTSESVESLVGGGGATSRVRLLLEGTGSLPLATGGVLTPRLEAGLRYDGGDAETGAGLELGAGLGYTTGRLAVEINARGLLAHEDTEYEEWGFSGSVAYQPGADGRGLSVNLGSTWGAAESGVQALWARETAQGLARNAPMAAAQRFQAEVSYGLEGRKGRALWVPFVGTDSAAAGDSSLRLGLKLSSGANAEMALEFGRRESGRGEPGHAVNLGGQIRW